MNIYRLTETDQETLLRLKRRAQTDIAATVEQVRPVVAAVRERGDAAVIEFTERFDGVVLAASDLRVHPQEFDEAEATLSDEMKQAVAVAVRNIRTFHERQKPEEMWFTQVDDGLLAGEKVTPLDSAGLYVPRGKGSFPSVLMMLAIPARVAGVPQIVVCTPPGEGGRVDAACLYAARLCGVEAVYRVGGAQAIAALAYGTETIPAVVKIVGPGNPYVTAAKHLLYGTVDVGPPAGPSEAIILADHTADPDCVALDLLNEAEHGPDSASLLVTPSEELARQVAAQAEDYVASLPSPRREFCERVFANFGGIVLTPDWATAVEFVNDYAPEHLEILTEQPFETLPQIRNAGEILLGPQAPIAVGNYCLGTNAILPTGGFAKSFSPVGVQEFLKRSGIGYLTRAGFERLREVTRCLADYEGFPAHAQAVRERS
jgi:histidinol dehydrogenase